MKSSQIKVYYGWLRLSYKLQCATYMFTFLMCVQRLKDPPLCFGGLNILNNNVFEEKKIDATVEGGLEITFS